MCLKILSIIHYAARHILLKFKKIVLWVALRQCIKFQGFPIKWSCMQYEIVIELL